MSDHQLLTFCTGLLRGTGQEGGGGLQVAVFGGARWRSLEDLLLACACGFHGQSVLRLLHEDENRDALQVPFSPFPNGH